MKNKLPFAVFGLFALQIISAHAECNPSAPLTRPNTRYEAVPGTQESEVLDKVTGLVWQRCPIGMKWTGQDCTGDAKGHTWLQALQAAAAAPPSTDAVLGTWRLPSNSELLSLVERSCANPAINTNWFPSTPPTWMWSSSPGANRSDDAWYADFADGDGFSGFKGDVAYVRLVRGASR
jgi:hypothetical protein